MVTRKNVVDRLSQLNYKPTADDYDQIDFELGRVLNYVKNYCNITEIPIILDLRITDKVCSDFLFYKKNSGALEGFEYDRVIKTIEEGDTKIQYATGQEGDTAESRFDTFVKNLDRGFDKWLTPHRRLRW